MGVFTTFCGAICGASACNNVRALLYSDREIEMKWCVYWLSVVQHITGGWDGGQAEYSRVPFGMPPIPRLVALG